MASLAPDLTCPPPCNPPGQCKPLHIAVEVPGHDPMEVLGLLGTVDSLALMPTQRCLRSDLGVTAQQLVKQEGGACEEDGVRGNLGPGNGMGAESEAAAKERYGRTVWGDGMGGQYRGFGMGSWYGGMVWGVGGGMGG